MNKYAFIIACLFFFILQSCRENALVKNATKELDSAVKYNLKEKYKVTDDITIKEIKTVYDNDSICILQCKASGKNSAGELTGIEYRYVYLIDMIMSRVAGRAIINDNIEECLCMPDELIRKSRKESDALGENVYEALYGTTLPIYLRKR